MDITVADFDGVLYHISNLPDDRSKIRVIASLCVLSILSNDSGEHFVEVFFRASRTRCG